jgi:hypothetical protein
VQLQLIDHYERFLGCTAAEVLSVDGYGYGIAGISEQISRPAAPARSRHMASSALDSEAKRLCTICANGTRAPHLSWTASVLNDLS